ncbi:MAG: biotin/lipoyl-binding protein [Dehalococcoidia bacterium]|jgi:biotin carboxyl carrier protein|nr:biotin/lipoyl-binding protein [Dehalococcoidia bacterium]
MAVETITSPLPGKIVSVKVSAGQKVKEGDLLLTIEAMKMENEIVATVTGTVTSVSVAAEATVQIGDNLVEIEEG